MSDPTVSRTSAENSILEAADLIRAQRRLVSTATGLTAPTHAVRRQVIETAAQALTHDINNSMLAAVMAWQGAMQQ